MVNPYSTRHNEDMRYLEYDKKAGRLRKSNAPNAVIRGEMDDIHNLLRRHVSGDFPCVFGRSVFKRGSYVISFYESIVSIDCLLALCDDLLKFRFEQDSKFFDIDSVFVSVFLNRGDIRTEVEFEEILWDVLSFMANRDLDYHQWDTSVSFCPDDGNFSFSFGGRAYFIVGMNEFNTRISRRFPYPLLVFNARFLFDKLRALNMMEKYRKIVRDRDIMVQGFVNQNLVNYTDSDSEAKLYSGRYVESNWICPFRKAK